MSKDGASLAPFFSVVAIVVGILTLFLTLFVPMYFDLQSRVSRLEGAFSVAEPLMMKPTVTQTVIVTTVTATATTAAPSAISVDVVSMLFATVAILTGLMGLYLVRRKV